MKTKLVLWGSNATDEKILIAMQLRPEDNKVDIWTFPETVATDEFARQLLGDWRNNVAVTFPGEATHLERELSMTDNLLPEEIKVERGDIVQRAQTEWHFVVLSSKLNEVYQTELSELKEKVEGLTSFNNEVWNDLKTFWNKVQDQVRERNLLRDHADSLRDETNKIFAKLKDLRSALDEEFRQLSQEHLESFMSALSDIEQQAAEGTRLPSLFDELKKLQRSFRETKLTREHRSKIWERLDAAFKVVKEKRFGPNANNESSAVERLTRRYNGLLGAIDKMQRSIARDEDDLSFQQRKIDTTDGQLEAQIRQAKIKMIQERIRSKNEKLEEMLQTKVELERRIATQKEKEARRRKQEEIAAAKQAAKEKIAKKIAAAAEARQVDEDKLEKAAEAIVKPKKAAKTKEEPSKIVPPDTAEDKEMTATPEEVKKESHAPKKEEAPKVPPDTAEDKEMTATPKEVKKESHAPKKEEAPKVPPDPAEDKEMTATPKEVKKESHAPKKEEAPKATSDPAEDKEMTATPKEVKKESHAPKKEEAPKATSDPAEDKEMTATPKEVKKESHAPKKDSDNVLEEIVETAVTISEVVEGTIVNGQETAEIVDESTEEKTK